MKTLWSFSLLLLLCADIVVFAQQKKVDYCEPIPKVKKELNALMLDDENLNYRQKYNRRLELLSLLLNKYPKDFHVLKANLDYRNDWYLGEYEKLNEEYRATFESNPNDIVSSYLYSQLITGHDTKRAIEILDKLTTQNPDFPWTYLKLSEIYISPIFRDEKKAKDNLRKWYGACPTSPSGYSLLSKVDDKELMRDVARNRRTMLEKSRDPEDFKYWSGLWSLEFKTTPSTEHLQVRIHIEDDLKRLRALKINHKNRLEALRAGYKFLDDKLSISWVENEILRNYPSSKTGLRWLRESWRNVNKRPGENDSKEKKEEYNRANLKVIDEWLMRWPNNWDLLYDKFMAAKDLDGYSTTELQHVVELLFIEEDKSDIDNYSVPPTSIEIAKVWLKRKVAVDQMPERLLKDLKSEEWRTSKQIPSDLYVKAEEKGEKIEHGNLKYVRWESWPVLIEVYLALKQPEKSREFIALMSDHLNKVKPSEKASNGEKVGYSLRQSKYWSALGKIAEFENRKLDALMVYQTAMSLRGEAPKKDDELKASFDRVWEELGGTEIGYNALAAANATDNKKNKEASYSAWNETNNPMKDFELSDIQGKKWTLADLKGKTVFINFWATWCGPCIEELPYVEKLHQQMKEKKDVLILTFNIDDQIGLVEPFLKTNNYTFTSVFAGPFADKNEVYGIPQNWIVSADSMIKSESLGFSGDGEEFIKKAIEAIEKVKSKQ